MILNVILILYFFITFRLNECGLDKLGNNFAYLFKVYVNNLNSQIKPRPVTKTREAEKNKKCYKYLLSQGFESTQF